MYEKVLWIFNKKCNEDSYFQKEKTMLLTKDHQKSYENAKICYICKEEFEKKNMLKIKKYCKVTDNCHNTGEHGGAMQSICNLKYNVPKKNYIPFHNGSNYDYHFIIKELGEEFKKQFTCLEENSEKYITFTVSIEKDVPKFDNNGEEIPKSKILHITFYW